jgi:hypothetical protein
LPKTSIFDLFICCDLLHLAWWLFRHSGIRCEIQQGGAEKNDGQLENKALSGDVGESDWGVGNSNRIPTLVEGNCRSRVRRQTAQGERLAGAALLRGV